MDVKPTLSLIVNEIEVMNQLSTDAIRLIHSTEKIPAIKKLVTMHELISLNLNVQRDFSGSDDIVWDLSALCEMKSIRHEMVVYHSRDFDPPYLLKRFVEKVQSILNTAQHRMGVSI